MPDNKIVLRNIPDQSIPVKNDVPVYLNSTIVKKTITINGTYNAATEQANGYSPVVVNVPTYEAENGELTAEVAELTETVAEKTAEIAKLEAEVGESFDRGYAEGNSEGYEKGKSDGVAEGIEQGYNNGFTDGVNSVEPVYESANGVLYKKNTVVNGEYAIPLRVDNYYENAEYIETFYAPDANRWSGYYTFMGAKNLKSVCLPKVSTVTVYMPFRNIPTTGVFESLQLGSVGYAVEKIQYSLATSNQQTPTIIIYVADDTTLPLSGSPFGFSNATIIYRSATTGEVLTV